MRLYDGASRLLRDNDDTSKSKKTTLHDRISRAADRDIAAQLPPNPSCASFGVHSCGPTPLSDQPCTRTFMKLIFLALSCTASVRVHH